MDFLFELMAFSSKRAKIKQGTQSVYFSLHLRSKCSVNIVLGIRLMHPMIIVLGGGTISLNEMVDLRT
jgi:hypothetical protein